MEEEFDESLDKKVRDDNDPIFICEKCKKHSKMMYLTSGGFICPSCHELKEI